MRFNPRDMRAVLVPPDCPPLSRRTYEDYEAGRRGIPQGVAEMARELYRRDREFMASIRCDGGIQIGPGIRPGEVLRRRQQAEFDAGVIRR